MKKIGIIGTGNMGEALIRALKAQGTKLKVAEKNVKKRNYNKGSGITGGGYDFGAT